MRLRLLRVKNLALMSAIVMVTAAASHAGSIPTASMQLTGVGDSVTLGSVYVDPYTATVGGMTNQYVVCDDWSNESFYNESWTAQVMSATTAGNSAFGTPMFGNNQPLYNELAWLGAQLLANPTNGTNQTEISFAIWDLSYGINGNTGTPSPLSYLSTNQNTAGQCKNLTVSCYQGTLNWVTEAEGEGSYNSAGWQIYNPVPGSQNKGYGTPQEFMMYTPQPTPEASQTTILAGDLLLFGMAVLVLRRRGSLAINR